MNDCMKKELRSNGVLLRLMKRMNIVRRYERDTAYSSLHYQIVDEYNSLKHLLNPL